MTEANRFRAGLCSICFRSLSVEQLIRLATTHGVVGIEWGADVHVPAGNLVEARRVARLCAEAGVACPSLGSYVRVGADDENQEFSAVLDTARALGAENVRVWAGKLGSALVDATSRQRTAERLRAHATAAAAHGITVSLEYHRNTLTDTAASTLDLLQRVDHPSLYSYWQPNPEISEAEWLTEIRSLSQRCSHVHVFHWLAPRTRRPLADGTYWPELMRALTAAGGWDQPRYAFLEHVEDDDVARFLPDFRVLQELCEMPSSANP